MRDDNEGGTPAGGPVRKPAAPRAAASPPETSLQAERAQDGGEGTSSLRPVSADMQQFIGRQLRALVCML